MAKVFGTARAAAILGMKDAMTRGLTPTAFLRELQAKGMGYRKTTLLSDWRNVHNIKAKEGLLRYVRKDYLPTTQIAQVKAWKLSREYLYVVCVETQRRPGEPIETRFVNISADSPLTPREIETEVEKDWGKWYPERRDEIKRAIAETAIRRAD